MYEDTTNGFYNVYTDQVSKWDNVTYFTISPNPQRFEKYDYVRIYDEWRQIFRHALYNTCHDYIIVYELAGLRPHFHGVASIKDKVGFTKRMFNISRYDNVKIHNQFKKGIPYLFKDVDNTYKATHIVPVFERDDDNNVIIMRNIERSLQKKQHQEKVKDDYPKWMLNTDSSDDTESV